MKEIYRNEGMILKSDLCGTFLIKNSVSDTIYTMGTKQDMIEFLKQKIEIYKELQSDVSRFIYKTSKEMLDYLVK